MTFYCLKFFLEKSLGKIKIWLCTSNFRNFYIYNIRQTLVKIRLLAFVCSCDWNTIKLLWLLAFLITTLMWIHLSNNRLGCNKLLTLFVFFDRRGLSTRLSLLKCFAYTLVLLIKFTLHRLFKWFALS